MDPLSAVSLAGTIVQLIDFGCKIVSKSKSVYTSPTGRSSVHEDIQSANERMKKLSKELIAKTTAVDLPTSQHESAIIGLSMKCSREAQKLSQLLDTLSLPKPLQKHKVFSSVRKAVESVWKEKQIREMEETLRLYSTELHLHLSAALYDKKSEVLSAINSLKRSQEDMQVEAKNDLLEARRDLLTAITDSQSVKCSQSSQLHDLDERLRSLLEVGHAAARVRKLLASLHFKKMSERQRHVRKKHEMTFTWIFNTKHASRILKFSEWLEKGFGIFWVTGKAGSGKSTLMKFVCEHIHTYHKVRIWSGEVKLVLATCFFWNAGTNLEKSQEGLIRSLLFEIFRQCPDLVTGITSKYLDDLSIFNMFDINFTLEELMDIFCQVMAQTSGTVNFCFFIDGLDEYYGEPADIVRLIQDLKIFPNVKLCLSSRPWPAFENAFGQDNQMMLVVEQHTTDDIKIYVDEVLGQDDLFVKLRGDDPRFQLLVKEIVAKAKGVFLWVFLVVNRLRNNLPNRDTVEELHRLVKQFPDELDSYFRHILDSIDKRYWEESSKVLLACLEVPEQPLDIMTVYFMLDDTCDPMNMPLQPIGDGEGEKKVRIGATRLKARCLDLLEVTRDERSNWEVGIQVDFLHRTVYDFLSQKRICDVIKSRVPESFNPCEAVCRASLAQLKTLPLRDDVDSIINGPERIIYSILAYSRRYRIQSKTSDKAFLLEVGSATQRLIERINDSASTNSAMSSLLEAAVRQGYAEFLKEKLDDEPSLAIRAPGRWLMNTALIRTCADFNMAKGVEYVEPAVIELLLRSGRNSMATADGRSLWVTFLRLIYGLRQQKLPRARLLKVVKALIQAGANPDCVFDINIRRNAFSDTSGTLTESKSALETLNKAFGESEMQKIIDEVHEIQVIEMKSSQPRWKFQLTSAFGWFGL